MTFNDSPHSALQLDEVVESILEYAASGESYHKSANLRVVCKQWREMSFKGFCRSTALPAIGFQHKKIANHVEEDELNEKMCPEVVFRRFPKTCPAHMALSEPKLPVEFHFTRFPSARDFALIQENSHNIASLSVYDGPWSLDNDDKQIDSSNFDIKLPNLKRVNVLCFNDKIIEPWRKLLQQILNTSHRVAALDYNQNSCPIFPPQVKHLNWTGLATNLGQLANPTAKQIAEFNLRLSDFAYTHDAKAESVAITEILERHSSTLKLVRIVTDHPRFPFVSLKLPPGPLPELRRLHTELPILLSKDTTVPKLERLVYRVGCHHAQKSDLLKVSHLASKTLVNLGLMWGKSLTPWAVTAKEEENREKEFVQEFQDESFPVYPQLLKLTVDKAPFLFGFALMPKVFSCMQNLTSLSLNFERQEHLSRHIMDDTDDLHKILIGVTSSAIPNDEKLWPKYLKNRAGAITNLKNLSRLKIRTSLNRQCVFGRFIFHAAFLPMEKLKMLRLEGGIKVEEAMIQEWESRDRKIKLN